ncbi:hypothetical protein [Actinoallomurus sp. CA-150999]|uniref:hypothetical protein n=1 Tax=Actinoallomurus sp. CA-150999 TaxID=3239887 RepID=UPI003D8F19A9
MKKLLMAGTAATAFTVAGLGMTDSASARDTFAADAATAARVSAATPASAAKTPCFTVLRANLPSYKPNSKSTMHAVTQIKQPKVCAGKIITVWISYSKNKNWHIVKDSRFRQKINSKIPFYVSHYHSFKCGTSVRTEVRLDGATWAGKSRKVCS